MSSATAREARPASAAQPDLPRVVGWALGSGTVLQGFNSSIIAVALVAIGSHFGDRDALPWLVSGMYVACAVASPSAGRFVDLFGPRRMYLVGLGIVLVAAVTGPFVPSVPWLVADRVVMGIGASVHFPAAMAIIRRLASDRDASGRTAIGTIALCGQTMAAIGPSIGGVVVLAFGWQGIFWVNLPLIAVSATLLLRVVPTSVDRRADRAEPRRGRVRRLLTAIDVPGLVLFVAALVLLMVGLLELDVIVAGDLLPLLWIVGSAPVWVLFVLRERRTDSPFIDVRLLVRSPTVIRTCGRGIVTFVAFYAVFYGLPQWFESARGFDAATAGLLMIPVFGTGVVSTLVATRASRRLAPRILLVLGGGAFLLAGALLAWVVTDSAPVWLLVVVGALLGVPNGFNNIGNQTVLHAGTEAASMGVASGLYRTAQYVGAALSAAVITLVLRGSVPDGGIRELGLVIATIGLVLVVLNGIAAARTRRPRTVSV